MTLKDSGVLFDPVEHRYWLDGRELVGITSTLVDRAFPNDYKKPERYTEEEWQAILDNAAERGTAIHKAVEHYETDGEYSACPELYNYAIIKGDHRLTWEASEYLVTDGECYASAIDLVMTDEEGGIVLGDIKTTSEPRYEKVACQLSIYKRFFEKQTGLKVSRIALIWLRGDKYEFRDLIPWADEVLDELFAAESADRKFDITTTYGDLPAKFAEVEEEIFRMMKEEERIKQRTEQLKEGLYALMEAKNLKKFTGQKIVLTRVLPTVSTTLDTKALKADMPDVWDKYKRESPRKGSLKITEKK